MFNSNKKWLKVPAQIKRFKSRSGSGKIEYDEPETFYCLPYSEIKSIVDFNGDEVLSASQLHVDGILQIEHLDKVIFEGNEITIKNVKTYYDGNTGQPSNKVVYL